MLLQAAEQYLVGCCLLAHSCAGRQQPSSPAGGEDGDGWGLTSEGLGDGGQAWMWSRVILVRMVVVMIA
jgi:hypothetical protein